MGLAERRAMKAYQENIFPEQLKRVHQAAGFEVPLEVEWESLCVDGRDYLFQESWTAVYFDSLVLAFESICSDDMGREALQASLKKVVLRNSGEGKYNAAGMSFEEGVLDIDHDPITNVGNVEPRKDALLELLEKAL